jgi:predicted nucleic acid-binding protein
MTTAVDTSVLLDILVDDARFGSASAAALRAARKNGRLVVCETVVAELRPALTSDGELEEFLDDMSLEFVPSDRAVAIRAGKTYLEYLGNKGTAKRVLPDFLVAAHAVRFADSLLARDRGYYRQYFKDLQVSSP